MLASRECNAMLGQYTYQEALQGQLACQKAATSQCTPLTVVHDSTDESESIVTRRDDRLQKVMNLASKLAALRSEFNADETTAHLQSNKYSNAINSLMLRERIRRCQYARPQISLDIAVPHKIESRGNFTEDIFDLKYVQAQSADELRSLLIWVSSEVPFCREEIDAALLRLEGKFEHIQRKIIQATRNVQDEIKPNPLLSR